MAGFWCKVDDSGQIVATSHDRFPPKGSKSEGKWDPLFQGNRSVGEILFHLARYIPILDEWLLFCGNKCSSNLYNRPTDPIDPLEPRLMIAINSNLFSRLIFFTSKLGAQ